MAYRRATAIQFSSPSSHRGPPTKDQSPGHQPCPQTGTLADRRSRCHCLRLVRLALIRLANNGLSHCRAAYEAARVAAAPCPRLCLGLPCLMQATLRWWRNCGRPVHACGACFRFCFRFSRRCLYLYLAILGASTESCLGCASDVRVMKHVGRRCAPGYFTLLSSGTIAMVFLLGC